MSLLQAGDSLQAGTPGLLELSSGPLVALSTVAMALFTFFLWRLHVNEYRMRHFARLHVCASRAVFECATNRIRVEVLLLNASDAPAIVENWEALVRDDKFRESVADGSLGPTKLMKVPAYLNGRGWVLERRLPTALSLHRDLGKTLKSGAEVDIEIHYAGGGRSILVLKHTVAVEIA